eukprot:TRINITY_DN7136_c0_g2_i2.p1 TRINITY_DN7136_c0_g2~~TRINITY_DN7136_c0_g2_i2.p1  ORF type:complete len:275 (+),score=62.84 TRINITY_DN7136_c0_g2_i2:180-1004(+)
MAKDDSALTTSKLFDVTNRVVVITGGSRGIGAFLAEAFAVNGAKVYISSRKAKACHNLETLLNKQCQRMQSPGQVIAVPADLSKEDGIVALATAVEQQEPVVHCLINNAGATWGEPVDTHPASAFDKLMTLNVRAVFQVTQRLLPLLRAGATEERPASVINIGSINGIGVSLMDTFSYSASKAAVHQLTRVLASKLAQDHVIVNAIAPGPFPTKMTEGVLASFGDVVREGVPLKRVGRPSDLAGLALLLAAPSGAYITGTVIPVDGGTLIKPSL